jgi:NADPH2:quinone reductase
MTFKGRELRSTITGDGKLVLSLEDVVTADPGIDELVVRVQAAPINPSDLGPRCSDPPICLPWRGPQRTRRP